MAGSCRIHLLGAFGVDINDRPVPPRAWRPQSAALVKVLALAPAHHLDQAEVNSKLWPTLTPSRSAHELRKAIKDVRKALDDELAITVEGERLRLWPHGELWVDAYAFAVHAKHARSIDNRTAAIALYRADLLPDDVDAPWTEPMRTRLRLMHLELMRDPAGGLPEWIDLRGAAIAAST